MALSVSPGYRTGHTKSQEEKKAREPPSAQNGITTLPRTQGYQLPGASPFASQFSTSFTIPSSLIFTSLRPLSAEASLT